MLESRVGRLEDDVKDLKADMKVVRSDLAELKGKVSMLPGYPGIALIVLIEKLNGPPVVLVVAALSGIGALLFATGSTLTRTRASAIASLAVLAVALGGTYSLTVNSALSIVGPAGGGGGVPFGPYFCPGP